MRKLRELIRLKMEMKLSGRAIARSCGISPATVSDYLGRVAVAKLGWPLPTELDNDDALNRLLFPNEGRLVAHRPEPDWAHVHLELRRKHVTKLLLWEEYRGANAEGFEYSQFCEKYLRWAVRLTVTMRQVHVAGDKCFVDFSGDGIDVVDPLTGECRKAKLFVAVLGASTLTYVEPVFNEELPTWIACHIHAFEFFGGVSAIVVPDNLRSGVTKASRYEPTVNQTYADMARHYGTAIIPARIYRPRDKAKVEQGVLLAERWILAVLRNRTFFSLDELREAVKLLVVRLNDRLMKKLKKSRRQLFDEMEKSSLKSLPSTPYEFADWAKPRVGINYHVTFDEHHYSVPYTLSGQQLELRATATTVEVFRGGKREASHGRSYEKNGVLDEGRAHAQGASRVRRMDAAAAHRLGENRGAHDCGRRRGHHGQSAPSPTGLQRLPGCHAPAPPLHARAPGTRLHPGQRAPRVQLHQRGCHPEEQPRQGRIAGRGISGLAASARERAGTRLLPVRNSAPKVSGARGRAGANTAPARRPRDRHINQRRCRCL
jgi:transposase